jgi:predicted RNA-binding protein YlxR (DUF448 family)
MKQKKELVRIVRSPEGELSVDLTGKKSGRGAYLCHKADCIELAKKKNTLGHHLKSQVSPEIYEELLKGANQQ